MKKLIKVNSQNIVVCILLLLISCSNETGKNSEEEKWMNIRNFYRSTMEDYKSKYNVKYDWTELDYKYTVQYDTILNGSDYQIISSPFFHDFYIENDTYYASVFNEYYTYSKFQFKLSVSNEVFRKIENTLFRDERQGWSFVIVKINDLKKTDNMIDVMVDKEYDIEVNRKPEDFFIGTGELIDFFQVDFKN